MSSKSDWARILIKRPRQFEVTPAGPTNGFTVKVAGNDPPGLSTARIDWSTLWAADSSPLPFGSVDTNASASPFRFFRVLPGPPLP
jgi:hypothetical protein